MKLPSLVPQDVGTRDADDVRLARIVAFTFLAAVAVVALYFGRDVLIPTALAIFFAFILGPIVTWLSRLLPSPLAVSLVVIAAVVGGGVLTVLVLSQLADVAGSLPGYQSNLHQKIQDVRALGKEGGALSRFMSMVASLSHDIWPEVAPVDAPAAQMPAATSNFAGIASFVAPLLQPLLSIGIIVILLVFILLDRGHLSDQFVRLFGASDVQATSEALSDAATRVARVLLLQLVTNLGFALLVWASLFALGMPNAALWGLLAGGLRFVPYVGPILGAVLPTVIAFAVLPGWLPPLLVLGCIIALDIIVGQVIEPLLFGESTGVTPLALILSAIFWATLWGPIGLLLSTPLTICLLVVGRHVPHLGFLAVLLGAEPALAPYQQIYRRLIRKAVAEASDIALAEIEAKGREAGLDDSMGRMVALAEADRALDRLTPAQIDAIVQGTDDVLEVLDDVPATAQEASAPTTAFLCIGGRGEIDDAAAALIAFALRQRGFAASSRHRSGPSNDSLDAAPASVTLICYASHASDAVRRYNRRKLRGDALANARHAIIDYGAATGPGPAKAGPGDVLAGDIAALCRLAAEHAVNVKTA